MVFSDRIIKELKNVKPSAKPKFYKCKKCRHDTLQRTPCPYHNEIVVREGRRIFVKGGLI